MHAFEIDVRVELVMDTSRQTIPFRNLRVRLALADGVPINRPAILAGAREEAVGVDRFLVRRRRRQADKDGVALREVVKNPIPIAKVGPMALVQDHQTEVVSIVTL